MKELTHYYLSLILVTLSLVSVAQNPTWTLPPNYWDGQLTTPPLNTTTLGDGYDGSPAVHTHNSISDADGNLLYFMVDGIMYNKDGYFLGEIQGLPYGGTIRGYSEVLFIPDPGNCNRFYVVSAIKMNHLSDVPKYHPFYAIFDMSETDTGFFDEDNNELEGKFVPNPEYAPSDVYGYDMHPYGGDMHFYAPGVFGSDPEPVFLSASNKRPDGTHFIFASNGAEILRYTLSDSGIQFDDFIFSLPSWGGGNKGLRSEMELIELDDGTYRLATAYRGWSQNLHTYAVCIVDIDENGIIIPGSDHVYHFPIVTEYPYPRGLEFSNSGRFLYMTHKAINIFPNAIEYFNLDNPSAGFQPLLIATDASDFEDSQIETGSDGNLYFATSDRLAVLINADDPTNATWISNAVSGFSYPKSDIGANPIFTNLYEGYNTRTLPAQIHNLNYDDFPIYTTTTYTAAGNATWTPSSNPFSSGSETVRISDELKIPEGVHITIEDMRFEFFDDARVVIEPGAWLTMDNTTFTVGPCEAKMWLGVEVHGNPNVAQLPYSNQGHLYMMNNSVIEHAYVGALAGRRANEFGAIDLTGGVIRAVNSRFRNNQCGVLITDYQWPDIGNRCNFVNCDFLTDNLLNHPEATPYYHAELNEVTDVRFHNCSFRNTAAFEDLSIENRGGGILSYLATFRVNGGNEIYEAAHDELPISDNVHQCFYQLRNGVLVVGMPNHAFTVTKMEFQRNKLGIGVLGASYETITFNNFEVPEIDDNYPGFNYGAYLINSYLFTIEENNFFGASELTRIAGLVIDNSCPDDAEGDGTIILENEVYRNQFTDLEIGILVENDNRDQDSEVGMEVGLQARCNEFSNNYRSDIYLAPMSEWRSNQGALFPEEMLTNNIFSMGVYNCGLPYHDLRVSPLYGDAQSPNDLTVDYHCFEYPPTTVPVMDNLSPDPNCAQDQLILYTVDGTLDYETHCPSNFSSSGGIKVPLAQLLQKQSTAEANLASAKAVYQATIDGGDTEDIIALLQNLLDEESAYLRDLLLASYPLSRKALMAALDAADSFDPWHLTQVLVANAPLAGDVYSFVKDNQVLSPFFFQFVEDAQANGGVNLGRLLYSEISLRSYEKSQAERGIHRHYLHHSDSLDAAAWNTYLESRDEPYYRLYRLGAHLDKGETGAAQTILDSLKLNVDSKDWFQFMIDLEVADTVTAADISSGWDFLYNAPAARGNVWGWLTAQGQLDSIPPLPPIAQPRSFSLMSDEESAKVDRWLEAYPNPAKDRVVLTYPHEADGIGTVQLFNADGRLMKTFAASDSGFEEINLTGWPTGVYIAKLFVNDKPIDTVKITVVK